MCRQWIEKFWFVYFDALIMSHSTFFQLCWNDFLSSYVEPVLRQLVLSKDTKAASLGLATV